MGSMSAKLHNFPHSSIVSISKGVERCSSHMYQMDVRSLVLLIYGMGNMDFRWNDLSNKAQTGLLQGIENIASVLTAEGTAKLIYG
jgi:hypothetical protein